MQILMYPEKDFWVVRIQYGIGECVILIHLLYNHDSYPRTWLNAGYKGEGLAIHDQFRVLLAPAHMKGQGSNLTGGGGGNGKYSGGGGGSNRGLGGDGTGEKRFWIRELA